jgi:hypothetical protein
VAVEALSPNTPLQHVDLLDPDLMQILLALGNGFDLIGWLLSDHWWSLIHCQHLDRFCRLTMRLLQILLKSCIARHEVREAYLFPSYTAAYCLPHDWPF